MSVSVHLQSCLSPSWCLLFLVLYNSLLSGLTPTHSFTDHLLSKEMSVILQKWKSYHIFFFFSFTSAIAGSIKSKNLCFEFSELLPFPFILYHCPYWPHFSQFGLWLFCSSKVQGTWSLLLSLHEKLIFVSFSFCLFSTLHGGIFLILLVLHLTRPDSTSSEKAFQTNIFRMVHSRITLCHISLRWPLDIYLTYNYSMYWFI